MTPGPDAAQRAVPAAPGVRRARLDEPDAVPDGRDAATDDRDAAPDTFRRALNERDAAPDPSRRTLCLLGAAAASRRFVAWGAPSGVGGLGARGPGGALTALLGLGASSAHGAGGPGVAPAFTPGAGPAVAAPLPPSALAALGSAGLPLKNFGVSIRQVETAAPLFELNADEPFMLASTAKVVTSLAALQLLGPTYRWHTDAFTTAPVRAGRTAGDLVVVGSGAGLTVEQVRRWFTQMRGEGLAQVAGRIVLEDFSLLHEQRALQAATTAAEQAPGITPGGAGAAPDARTYNRGALVVSVQPAAGPRADVTLTPRPPGVRIVNDVLMGGGCSARARWSSTAGEGAQAPELVVEGRWDASCGREDIAFLKLPVAPGGAAAPTARPGAVGRPATAGGASTVPATSGAVRRPATGVFASPVPSPAPATRSASVAPAPANPPAPASVAPGGRAPVAPLVSPAPLATPALVASLWAETGGRLGGSVVETGRGTRLPAVADALRPQLPHWSSRLTTVLTDVVHAMNKVSDNVAAKGLLLALAPPSAAPAAALPLAQGRVAVWLQKQGFAADDLRIDEGSGQSHAERGKPRAMVALLCNAWHSIGSREFLESLPVAGVDGTLAGRMRDGPARGSAFMKTGTLADTRALAGYVIAKSGKVYALAVMVTHPQASRATPALDALVEWLARTG